MKIQSAIITTIMCLLNFSASAEQFTETLYPAWGQTFEISKVIAEVKTGQQDLILFENDTYGRVLALDGAVQTTEKDEFVYHEMITHVPILAHGDAKEVLIIGGGDGGALREVLRHKNVKRVTIVEIDEQVISFCKEFLPNHSKGAFSDPRVRVIIQDAFDFTGLTQDKFDVIICDSTDPIGPGAVLFREDFYGRCKNILNENGIFVSQNGVPFMQPEELVKTHENLSKFFGDAGFYVAPVPTYVGGFMTFGWASDNKKLRHPSQKEIVKRLKSVDGEMLYYTPAIHKASFALPRYIESMLEKH